MTSAHTNTVERKWWDVRACIPKYGVRQQHFVGYLAEYLLKLKHQPEERICQFFRATARLYPPKYQ